MPISDQEYPLTSFRTAKSVSVDGLKAWLRYLKTLSFAQGELNKETYYALLRAASCGVPAELAIDVCCEQIESAGDVASRSKVEQQAVSAYNHVARTASTENPTERVTYPEFDAETLADFVDGSPIDERSLAARSPVDIATITSPEAFLAALYKQGEYVLVFSEYKSQGQALWPVDPLPKHGPDGIWFLGNPVDGYEHPNPRLNGKLSSRSEEAVTSFRFAVVESDKADPNLWLKALARLQLRIAAIYTSGGRSIHALVRVDAGSKAHWDEIINPLKPMLMQIGADRGCLTAVRLTRLPNTFRGPGPKQPARQAQRLLYLNPEPDGTPIEKQTIYSV